MLSFIQIPEALQFSNWGWLAANAVGVFIVYLLGFLVGYKSGKKARRIR